MLCSRQSGLLPAGRVFCPGTCPHVTHRISTGISTGGDYSSGGGVGWDEVGWFDAHNRRADLGPNRDARAGLLRGGSVPSSFDRSLLRLRAFQDYLADGWALIGTPDEVRDGLNRYLDATGYERVLLLMALPGLSTDLALRSMRLFADEVAPKLARHR